MKIKTKCICGEKYIIETNSKNTMRADKKRVYPINDKTPGLCSFRCRNCGMPVNSSVKYAGFNTYDDLSITLKELKKSIYKEIIKYKFFKWLLNDSNS